MPMLRPPGGPFDSRRKRVRKHGVWRSQRRRWVFCTAARGVLKKTSVPFGRSTLGYHPPRHPFRRLDELAPAAGVPGDGGAGEEGAACSSIPLSV